MKPGVSGSDPDMNTVTFNAVLLDESQSQTRTMFVLDAEDAQRLGQELVQRASQTLANRREAQEETIRRMEDSR